MYAPIREEGAAPRDLWPKNRDGIIGRTSRATDLGYGASRVATNRSAAQRKQNTPCFTAECPCANPSSVEY